MSPSRGQVLTVTVACVALWLACGAHFSPVGLFEARTGPGTQRVEGAGESSGPLDRSILRLDGDASEAGEGKPGEAQGGASVARSESVVPVESRASAPSSDSTEQQFVDYTTAVDSLAAVHAEVEPAAAGQVSVPGATGLSWQSTLRWNRPKKRGKPGKRLYLSEEEKEAARAVDAEMLGAARAVIDRTGHATRDRRGKIAFLFLTRGPLPLDALWAAFFRITWGSLTMITATRRLLARALLDTRAQRFVLLSDSKRGRWRYSQKLLPLIPRHQWYTGSQWFAIRRYHAELLVKDEAYWNQFVSADFFIADEHYVQTVLSNLDEAHVIPRSVAYRRFSTSAWHPETYFAENVTAKLLHRLQVTHWLAFFGPEDIEHQGPGKGVKQVAHLVKAMH
eukprot:jgi/Mesen1/403/ME000010S_10861